MFLVQIFERLSDRGRGKGGERRRHTEADRHAACLVHFPNGRSQKLQLGLPHGQSWPKNLAITSCLSRYISRSAVAMSWTGTWIWNAGAPSSALTCNFLFLVMMAVLSQNLTLVDFWNTQKDLLNCHTLARERVRFWEKIPTISSNKSRWLLVKKSAGLIAKSIFRTEMWGQESRFCFHWTHTGYS